MIPPFCLQRKGSATTTDAEQPVKDASTTHDAALSQDAATSSADASSPTSSSGGCNVQPSNARGAGGAFWAFGPLAWLVAVKRRSRRARRTASGD